MRRIGGDAGAKQRRRALERNALRDPQHVILVDGDASGIAAIGRGLTVALVAVIGERHAGLAILLFARKAGLAFAAGIDEAADADDVALVPLADMVADRGDTAHDLVPGHHGEDRAAPFVAGLVNVGMANAAIEDVDQDLVGARLAPLDAVRGKRRRRRLSRVGGGL